jgi:hypothetical protein
MTRDELKRYKRRPYCPRHGFKDCDCRERIIELGKGEQVIVIE